MTQTVAVDLELEVLMKPTKRFLVSHYRRKPHFLKGFFRERGISQQKLGQVMGVPQTTISEWFNNAELIPPKAEARLLRLHEKILRWEERTGRKFGA
jgi:DNA-binding transcriptional regulator YiaG